MPGPTARRVVILGGASGEGTPTEPDPPPTDFETSELWSIMHLGFAPIGVPIPDGTLDEADQAMLVGAYAGFDYT
jgi:hypothetical protein